MTCPTGAHGVRSEQSGDVCVVTLASPPLNVLTIAVLDELARAIECARTSDSARVLLLKSEGKCFSGGADVAEHLPGTVRRMLASFHGVIRALHELPMPTIAVVDGAALGGGLELAASCDMVIATDRAKFGQPEIKLGVLAPVATLILPALVGPRAASRLLLTGATIDAEEAARIGLVTEVVPQGALPAAIEARLEVLGGLSRAALGHAARAARRAAFPDFVARLEASERFYLDEIAPLPDAEEGLRAFLEKRAPRFGGGARRS